MAFPKFNKTVMAVTHLIAIAGERRQGRDWETHFYHIFRKLTASCMFAEPLKMQMWCTWKIG
jgi:hypothetical protein